MIKTKPFFFALRTYVKKIAKFAKTILEIGIQNELPYLPDDKERLMGTWASRFYSKKNRKFYNVYNGEE
jgi:hypothetical protein